MFAVKLSLKEAIYEFSNNSLKRIFIVVSVLNLAILIFYNHFIWDVSIYLNISGLKESDPVFIKGQNNRYYIDFITYLISPFWVLIKLGFASMLIYLFAYLFRISILFKDILKVLMVSFIVIIFGDLVNCILLILVKKPVSDSDILHYYPLSILSFIDPGSYLNKFYSVFSRINLFQVLFIICNIYLFNSYFHIKLMDSLILMSSYVVFYSIFLLLWFLILL